jgi:lipoyl(octanoyl) transferase
MQARLIFDLEKRPGWFQMAADDLLASPVLDQTIIPTVRTYFWQPPAVSLGRHQPHDAVDSSLCLTRGWDIVRRPTGGRALLHSGDLSYSVILPGGISSPGLLRTLYDGVAEALKNALAEVGVIADYIPKGREALDSGRHIRAGLCLDSRVRGELLAHGRKVAAAAQRIYPRSILQHGSLPLNGDLGEIAFVSQIDTGTKIRAAERLRASAISVSEASGREISYEELAGAIIDSIAKVFDLSYLENGWRDEELAEISRRKSAFEIVSCLNTKAI